MDRWVVGRDEAEALAAAQQRFPGRPLQLVQVRRCGLGRSGGVGRAAVPSYAPLFAPHCTTLCSHTIAAPCWYPLSMHSIAPRTCLLPAAKRAPAPPHRGTRRRDEGRAGRALSATSALHRITVLLYSVTARPWISGRQHAPPRGGA